MSAKRAQVPSTNAPAGSALSLDFLRVCEDSSSQRVQCSVTRKDPDMTGVRRSALATSCVYVSAFLKCIELFIVDVYCVYMIKLIRIYICLLNRLTCFRAQLPQTLEEVALAIARVEKLTEAERQQVCARARTCAAAGLCNYFAPNFATHASAPQLVAPSSRMNLP